MSDNSKKHNSHKIEFHNGKYYLVAVSCTNRCIFLIVETEDFLYPRFIDKYGGETKED
ncbi:hypothetical protein [Clostridium sp.]|uniref:hypothetical protein n=1 Tax=Clostridium sp. TaxID=1506 RepID=UPI002621C1A6|nr:hypothetical protein [uncultured Clostridium sp.]